MIKIIIITFTAFLFLVNCSGNNITNPEPEPGRRDYVWTIDTLDISAPAYFIWGSSPFDVWVTTAADFNHSLWHYNGSDWSTDGIFRFILPKAIWGFSSDNIYIGGSAGKIWKYNGSDWSENVVMQKDGHGVGVQSIWGESKNDFYAMGASPDEQGYFNNSVIAHYKNNNWTMLNTDGLKGLVVHMFRNNPDKRIYLLVSKIGGIEHADSTLIYECTGGTYNKIYSSIENMGYQADIRLINQEVYFILGDTIAKRKDNQFQTFLNVENPKFYQRIWGRSSKDIFLLMTDGLAHYNGDNIEYLIYFKYPDSSPLTQIYDAAIFEKEVFFTTDEPPTYLEYIYHGILLESE